MNPENLFRTKKNFQAAKKAMKDLSIPWEKWDGKHRSWKATKEMVTVVYDPAQVICIQPRTDKAKSFLNNYRPDFKFEFKPIKEKTSKNERGMGSFDHGNFIGPIMRLLTAFEDDMQEGSIIRFLAYEDYPLIIVSHDLKIWIAPRRED